jgi:hypothetical protein
MVVSIKYFLIIPKKTKPLATLNPYFAAIKKLVTLI